MGSRGELNYRAVNAQALCDRRAVVTVHLVALGSQGTVFRYLALSESAALFSSPYTSSFSGWRHVTEVQFPRTVHALKRWGGLLGCRSPPFVLTHSGRPSAPGALPGWLSPAYADAQSRVLPFPALDSTERSNGVAVAFLIPFTCDAKIQCGLPRPETLPTL